jgi:hypothetical protein
MSSNPSIAQHLVKLMNRTLSTHQINMMLQDFDNKIAAAYDKSDL